MAQSLAVAGDRFDRLRNRRDRRRPRQQFTTGSLGIWNIVNGFGDDRNWHDRAGCPDALPLPEMRGGRFNLGWSAGGAKAMPKLRHVVPVMCCLTPRSTLTRKSRRYLARR